MTGQLTGKPATVMPPLLVSTLAAGRGRRCVRRDAGGYFWFVGRSGEPGEVAFDQNLPRTHSGTVVRRLLRAREPGPAGRRSVHG